MIKIGDKALEKLKQLRKDNQILRVAVVGGGCSGMSYKLSWVDAPAPNDHVAQTQDLTVVVDPKSKLFINGLELDFSDGLDGTGFTYSNPQARRSCGCGSSFSAS
jgi:iron-sulfur cluster assembly protein